MKILIVTHYFPPEIGAPQARLSEFARFWAEAGDDVTVLTGMPNHPTGVIPPEYKGAIRRVEHVDGYRVVRTWLYATPNEGFAKKTLGHLSFMLSSVLLGFRKAGRPDVVVVSSPTFFSIFSAWLISRLRRAPLVVEVRDLWPAIFVELGVLRNPALVRVLEKMELWFYSQASAVVVVSDGFRQNLIERNVPAQKVWTFRNGVDLEYFQPHWIDRDQVRRDLGVPLGCFLVLYVGAHGISQGLTTIADAANRLRDDPLPHFCFIGEGADKDRLSRYVADLDLPNVTLLPAKARSEVPDILEASDLCLVPLRNVTLFSSFIPSKMFEMMASGRPILGAVRGEASVILSAAGAYIVEPEDSQAIAENIARIMSDPQDSRDRGLSGRRFAERNADRRVISESYRLLLSGLATKARG